MKDVFRYRYHYLNSLVYMALNSNSNIRSFSMVASYPSMAIMHTLTNSRFVSEYIFPLFAPIKTLTTTLIMDVKNKFQRFECCDKGF